MALDSSSSRTRSITAIGAGAVLFAVIGYLLLNKNRKKSKKKSKLTNFENMQAILASSKEYNTKKSEQIVPNNNNEFSLEPKTSSSYVDTIDMISINESASNNDSKIKIESLLEDSKNVVKTEHDLNKPIETSSPLEAKIDNKFFNNQEIENENNNKIEISNEILNLEKNFQEEIISDSLNEEDNQQTSKDASIIELELNSLKLVETDNQLVPMAKSEEQIVAVLTTPKENLLEDELNEDKLKENQENLNLIKSSSSSSASSERSESFDSTNVSTSSFASSISPPSSSSSVSSSSSKSIQNPQPSQKNIIQINQEKSNQKKLNTKPNQNKQVNENKTINNNNNNNNNTPKKLNEPKLKSKSNKPLNDRNNISKSLETNDKKLDDDNKAYEDLVVYEFNFPRKFCGKLIGKNGVNVDFIRSKTHTQIAVRNDPNLEELQIVCVSGCLEDVDRALDIIRSRFPVKHYPQISFKPITKPIIYRRYNPESKDTLFTNCSKVLVAPNMYVDLTSVKDNSDKDGLFNVYVSAVVSVAHVFIQIPNNSTFENLQKLDQNMLEVYSNVNENTPLMIEPIEYGSICVAPTSYGWHRAMVTNYISKNDAVLTIPNYEEECGLATIKFLDYGGYLTVPINQLRQLRSDFMVLPFQAIECYLDGICPYEGTELEGKNYLSELIRNSSLKANITGYSEDGIPVIKIFLYNHAYDGLDINNELVTNNFAFNLKDSLNQKENYNLDDNQLVPQTV